MLEHYSFVRRIVWNPNISHVQINVASGTIKFFRKKSKLKWVCESHIQTEACTTMLVADIIINAVQRYRCTALMIIVFSNGGQNILYCFRLVSVVKSET